jgi:predicted ATPase
MILASVSILDSPSAAQLPTLLFAVTTRQRKDPEQYPELAWCAREFSRIQVFREWSFGRYSPLRQPQPADLPTEFLLPDARNLGLILKQIEHSDSASELNALPVDQYHAEVGRQLPCK